MSENERNEYPMTEKNSNSLNKLTISAMFLALGIILPFFTGQIPQIGSMLLPMHIPVFLCALICGWRYGVPMAIILPLLRCLLFGVPNFYPQAISIAFEMATYAFVAGYLYDISKPKTKFTLYKVMLISMLLGRIVRALVQLSLLSLNGTPVIFKAFFTSVILAGIPGIILQLIIVPYTIFKVYPGKYATPLDTYDIPKQKSHPQKIIKSGMILLPFLLLSSTALSGCTLNTREKAISKSAIYFDTAITITLYSKDDDSSKEKIFDELFSICKDYENICDRHNSKSELSKLNKRDLEYTTVNNINMYKISPTLYDMISKGVYAYENYSKEFDITLAPLIDIWNFKEAADLINKGKNPLPSQSIVTNALKNTGCDNIILSDGCIGFKDNNNSIKIDLGGLAKGYIADHLKEYLLENNYKNALIDLGGNIYALGSHMDETPFTIGVKKPFTTSGEYLTTLQVTNKSVVTSGIYERYFEYDSGLYHHILSSSTGYPCENDLLSVTIINESSLTCDILSTTCLLLGKESATTLIESLDNTKAIFIDKNYEITQAG